MDGAVRSSKERESRYVYDKGEVGASLGVWITS